MTTHTVVSRGRRFTREAIFCDIFARCGRAGGDGGGALSATRPPRRIGFVGPLGWMALSGAGLETYPASQPTSPAQRSFAAAAATLNEKVSGGAFDEFERRIPPCAGLIEVSRRRRSLR